MLRKIWKQVLAVVFVLSLVVVGATQTEAAALEKQTVVRNHTATIVVEDISNEDFTRVANLSGIRKMSGAIKWIEDNAVGRDFRFVSTDPELLESWKESAVEAGFKVKKEKKDYKKISVKALKQLKRGETYYSFEVKTIKRPPNRDGEKALSIISGVVGTALLFR